MKKITFYFSIIFLFYFSNIETQTVYITKTGKKYHKNSCHYLKYSKKEVELKYVLDFGYLACKICKPSSITSKNKIIKKRSSSLDYIRTTSVQCKGKIKSGRRCKRRTKNDNGRCYQH